MSNQHHARTFTKRLFLIAAMLTGLGFANPNPAASNASYQVYVSVPGIQGESADQGVPGFSFKGQIEASSFSWGAVRNDSVTSTGSLSGASATVAPFTITKALDRASVGLALAVIKGYTYPSVVVTVTRWNVYGWGPFAMFTLKNARVIAANTVGTGMRDATDPVEEVQFSFSGMTMDYWLYDKMGLYVGKISSSW